MWKVTVRAGSRVEHARYEGLDDALDQIEARARSIAGSAPRRAVDVKFKSFEPVDQVAARIELAGPQRLVPSVRAGVDVRGDGSTEAFVGRIRRRILRPEAGETALAALRRTVADAGKRSTGSLKT